VRLRFALPMLFVALFAARAQGPVRPASDWQITFAQITDAHIFDEGWMESGSDPFRHALDDRVALHWAIDEINRLYLAEKPEDRISFIVYTGDLGLQNVFFPQNAANPSHKSAVPQSRNCNVIAFKPQPGLPPISSQLAEDEVVAEFDRLAVRKVYILPGNNDLIDEQVADWPRYDCFVDELKVKLLALPHPVYLESLTVDHAVNAGPVRLAGLDSASFKDVSKYSGACSGGTIPVTGAPSPVPLPPGCPEPQLRSLQKLLAGGQSAPLLLFTHIPDLIDPYRKKPSWQIDVSARGQWEQEACDAHLLGIFTGHFHSADRSLYATNTGTAKLALKKCVADKTWVTPPLAVKVQTKDSVQARGLVVVTIRGGASAAIKVDPDWYPGTGPPPPRSEQSMNLKYFSVIIGVILFAGTLGGWMNYLVSQAQTVKDDQPGKDGAPPPEKRVRWSDLSRSMLLGIGAAFLVPLFLNMISSTLVENTHSLDKGFDYPKILVFLGFCLVAAISSTAFIKTISERVLRLAEEAKKTGHEAKEEAREAKQQASETESKMEPILKLIVEPNKVASETVAAAIVSDPKEQRVLRALLNPEYRLRTVAGIVAEADIAMEDAVRILNELKAKGLVDSTTVITRGVEREGFRWFVTSEGRKALPPEASGNRGFNL
jgi:hypothetical protein